MKKIKFLMPILGLSSIAITAIPLTSCGCTSSETDHMVEPTEEQKQPKIQEGEIKHTFDFEFKEEVSKETLTPEIQNQQESNSELIKIVSYTCNGTKCDVEIEWVTKPTKTTTCIFDLIFKSSKGWTNTVRNCKLVYTAPQGPALENIEITAEAENFEYFVGDKLDLKGLEVTAKFADGETKVISDYTTEPSLEKALTTEDKKVEISYTSGGITKKTSFVIEVDPIPLTDYVHFTGNDSFTLGIASTSSKGWDGKLEYSTDKSQWTEWDGTITISSSTLSGGISNLYLRGTNNTIIDTNFNLSGDATEINCSEDIRALLDYKKPTEVTMQDKCFRNLFKDCTKLKTGPVLTPKTLSVGCYANLFKGCTELKKAPRLLAETLASYCYQDLFQGCTSLEKAPTLKATEMKDHCYYEMFDSCSSLKVAPKLKAETLADYCYTAMFYHCTSIETAPELPATTLAASCYYAMFNGCTSLKSAPILGATTLPKNCYRNMFYDCSSLKINNTGTGTLFLTCPSDISAYLCVDGMFKGTGGSYQENPISEGKYYFE